jgi:hypothetical protein
METDNLFAKMTRGEMQSALVDREMDSLDFNMTYCILMEGRTGYNDMSDEDIEEQYITHFGDSIKKEVEFNFN